MAELIVLGSGSGISTKNRFHSSIYLESSGKALLVDCGEPAGGSLVRCGKNIEQISGIIISHMHVDHCGGLPQLLQNMQLSGRREPLKIFMPEEGIDAFTDFLETVYLFKELMPFELEILPVSTFMDIAIFKINAIPNSHLQNLKGFAGKNGYSNSGESNSFIVEFEENANLRRIAFTGDVASCQELEKLTDNDPDILITEAAHFPSDVLTGFLAGKPGVKQIIISHISPTLDDNPVLGFQNLPLELEKKMIIAKDLQKVFL
jgi:ribonuclease Z